ncbi:hypothetical protein FACS18948_3020 [Clostridia bacterium]|nr:hypothetical protein FACS18948_3020 [Clostridia bacterium]
MDHKNALFITGNRNGYSPDQCGRTMTVGELIALLQDYDENLKVYFRNDNGFTYGSITERDFESGDDADDDEEDEDE